MTSWTGVGLSSSSALRGELEAAWPVRQPERADGYRPLALDRARVVDAARLGARTAMAVVAAPDGARAGLPIVDDEGWRVAVAGDGLAVELLAMLDGSARHQQPGCGFQLASYAPVPRGEGTERTLGTDQTNTSVVVGDRVIVKWRTAFDADGRRALTLRRHLAEVGFAAMPRLLGALTWTAPVGTETVLADVDAFLPGAEDGWEAFTAELIDRLEARSDDPLELAVALGRLAGELHAALSMPSSVIRGPVEQVGGEAVASWREEGLALVDRAADIEADDAAVVRDRAGALRRDIQVLQAIHSASVQPVHGDLHIGQVIRWRAGLAVIDFDGPPGTRAIESPTGSFERGPAARDLAQLLCSLDLLAVVVAARTEGRHEATLRRWIGAARQACLAGYRAHAPAGLLDERLLSPFLASQLCRELVYAADVLPRWRYAPIGALRWRYPEATT